MVLINPGRFALLKTEAKATRSRMPPEQRRAQLLSCAIAAFAEHGVARVTHAHVAALAHVSVAAVHSYFRTREDLVAETLTEVEASLLKIVTRAVREGVSARTALTEMVTEFDRAAQEDSDVVKVWLDWSTGFRADVWPRYLLMQEQLHAAVRKVLAAGKRRGEISEQMNIKAAARLFIGGGHTVALTRFAGASPQEIEILIDHLIRSIMSIGLEADRATAPLLTNTAAAS